jgi:hypothetical protein
MAPHGASSGRDDGDNYEGSDEEQLKNNVEDKLPEVYPLNPYQFAKSLLFISSCNPIQSSALEC